MRPAVFSRLRLSLQNTVTLLSPVLSLNLVQRLGEVTCVDFDCLLHHIVRFFSS